MTESLLSFNCWRNSVTLREFKAFRKHSSSIFDDISSVLLLSHCLSISSHPLLEFNKPLRLLEEVLLLCEWRPLLPDKRHFNGPRRASNLKSKDSIETSDAALSLHHALLSVSVHFATWAVSTVRCSNAFDASMHAVQSIISVFNSPAIGRAATDEPDASHLPISNWFVHGSMAAKQTASLPQELMT